MELARTVLVPVLLGLATLRALGAGGEGERLAHAGRAYAVGALASALVLYAWGWVGFPESGWTLDLVLVALAFALWARSSGRSDRRALPAARPRSRERALLVGTVGGLLLVLGLRAVVAWGDPVHQGDEALIWERKARLLVRAGGFGPRLAELARDHGVDAHLDYPLLDPLLQLSTFLRAGEVVHTLNRVPIQLAALATVPLLAALLAHLVRPVVATALLLLTLASWQALGRAKLGAAEPLVLLGTVLCLAALCDRRPPRSSRWALGSIGAGLALFAKHDALLLAAALVAGASLAWLRTRRLPKGRAVAWVLLPVLLVLLTIVTNLLHDFANDLATAGSSSGLPRPARLLEELRAEAGEALPRILATLGERGLAGVWRLDAGLLVLGFLVACLLAPRRACAGPLAPWTLACATFLAALVGVYVLTYRDLVWHLDTSLDRLLFEGAPLFAVWLALFLRGWPGLRAEQAESRT